LSTDRENWLAERRQGIGASDAPTVVGVRKEPSRFRLWLEKRGETEPEPPNEAMQWGLRLEPAIADAFEERTGLKITSRQASIRHPERTWMRATVDGIVERSLTLVEMKACGSWSARKLPEDGDATGLPEPWIIQAQHQMEVTGCNLVKFAVFADLGLRIYDVARDDALIAEIIALEELFWHCVENGSPPAEFEVTDLQAIGRYFNRDDAPPISLSPVMFGEAVCGYKDAVAVIKDAEDRRDVYKAQLLMAMGNAPLATCEQYTLKRKVVETKERTQTVKASKYVRFTISNGDTDA
jgi:putative phage-type endonuclease